jgi:hypothetical protein
MFETPTTSVGALLTMMDTELYISRHVYHKIASEFNHLQQIPKKGLLPLRMGIKLDTPHVCSLPIVQVSEHLENL